MMYDLFFTIEKKNTGAQECVKLDRHGISLVPCEDATRFSDRESAEGAMRYVGRPFLVNGWSDLIVVEHSWLGKE